MAEQGVLPGVPVYVRLVVPLLALACFLKHGDWSSTVHSSTKFLYICIRASVIPSLEWVGITL